MNVLITGAAGSVGRLVSRELLRRGHRCRLFDISFDISAADPPGGESSGAAEIVQGDIRDEHLIRQLATDIDCAIHLAALLPPASERSRALTMAINCAGTRSLLAGLRSAGGHPQFVFASSVSTYGDTTRDPPPIRTDHRQRPLDTYAESKILGEALVRSAEGISWTILRITGVAVPDFLEPPAVWPFQTQQRVEFICRDDVAQALANCVGNTRADRKVLNVAGGSDWQMIGRDYVAAQYDIYGVDLSEARFRDEPGWLDWYDTAEGQVLLAYQQTSFAGFCQRLARAVDDALPG